MQISLVAASYLHRGQELTGLEACSVNDHINFTKLPISRTDTRGFNSFNLVGHQTDMWLTQTQSK